MKITDDVSITIELARPLRQPGFCATTAVRLCVVGLAFLIAGGHSIALAAGHDDEDAFMQAQGQSPMTNQDVLDMVKAGLSASLIVTSIERAPLTRFDVQPSNLVTLKGAGVPDLVLEAMMKAPTASRPSAAPAVPAPSPAPSVAPSSAPSSAAPSQAEVRACVATLDDLGKLTVLRMQYGTPMLSQGGAVELGLGAPSGTQIQPVRVRFRDFRTGEVWLFRDPFGSLKCVRRGEVEYRPPTTREEMAAGIREGDTVTLPIKIATSPGAAQLTTATVSISSAAVVIPSLNVSVETATISNVKIERVGQLTITFVEPTRLPRDLIFFDPAVQAIGAGVSDCSRCGPAIATIEALIKETAAAAAATRPPASSGSATRASLASLLAALERGETVEFKISYTDSAWTRTTAQQGGRVTVSKEQVTFEPAVGSTPFSVSPKKLLELVNEPQVKRIKLKVAIPNKKGDKEDTKSFEFFHPDMFMDGLRLGCTGCDASMDVLYAVLDKVRLAAIVGAPDTAALAQPPTPASVAGKYVEKVTGAYVELRADGKFTAGSPGGNAAGTYTVQGDALILTFVSGRSMTTKLVGNKIISSGTSGGTTSTVVYEKSAGRE